MFVDASAMVAVLSGEPGRAALLSRLDDADVAITSALAVYETVVALTRKKNQSVDDSEEQVLEFLRISRIRTVPLAEREGVEALTAFRRFGKGQGHPAQLNMGDCFSYACARTHDVPLLFVGSDFSQTDIRSAMT